MAAALFLACAPLVPQSARAIIQLNVAKKIITLNDSDLERKWEGLSLDTKRLIVPYLIEQGDENGPRAKRIREMLGREKDATLAAYHEVAKAYFATKSKPGRASRLRRIRATGVGASVLKFYEAMALGHKLNHDDYQGICTVPDHESLCDLSRFGGRVLKEAGGKKLSFGELKNILRLGRPFLAREPIKPPFYAELGADIPEALFAVGLPLEAAILGDRMGKRERVPYYLGAAADFNSALRYAQAYPRRGADEVLLDNTQLDWMILAGRYRDAIRLIADKGPEKLAPSSVHRHRDYWTAFELRPDVIRLRLALLLHLAGDTRKAVRGLERLRFSGRTLNGEPEKYFARLRLAQLLVRENPELAHKIAEDISYIAQENDWRVLEYHATLLDGWANYFRDSNYKALIAFTKAGGILGAKEHEHSAEYSRLLGKLSAKIRMNKDGDYSDLIKEIGLLLNRRPYNEAIYTIREWTPQGVGPDFFIEQATINQIARNDRWGSLNLMVEFDRAREHFFEPGKNPGGARGFVTSALWSRELAKFGYVEKLYPGAQPAGHALELADSELLRAGRRALSPGQFTNGDLYWFSFSVKEGRFLYLVHPSRVKQYYWSRVKYKRKGRWRYRRVRRARWVSAPSIAWKRLDADVTKSLGAGCNSDYSGGCDAHLERFKGARAIVESSLSKNAYVRVQYSADFDLEYEKLLGIPGRLIYFYSSENDGAKRADADHGVYYGEGCRSGLARSISAAPGDFEAVFGGGGASAGGVWLWPETFDTRAGKDKPVYLRRFSCGNAKLRFWEMDRFSDEQGPGLLLYNKRGREPGLNQAFARHFAEKGTVLLELETGAAVASAAKIVESVSKGGKVTPGSVLGAYRRLAQPGVRLILPYIFD